MTCWLRFLLIGLVIGGPLQMLALPSPRKQAQQGPPGSKSAQSPNEEVAGGEAVGPRVPAKPGETCIACANPVGSDDSVYLVQGQRVPVHADEEREFLSNPRKYLPSWVPTRTSPAWPIVPATISRAYPVCGFTAVFMSCSDSFLPPSARTVPCT